MAIFEVFKIYLKGHFHRVKKPRAPDERKIKTIEPRLNRENREKLPEKGHSELQLVILNHRKD